MLDERRKTRDERGAALLQNSGTFSSTLCHPERREGSSAVYFSLFIFSLLLFSACTDYQEEFENAFGALEYTDHSSESKPESSDGKVGASSSSNKLSSAVETSTSKNISSSSIKEMSSSSAKSSSSHMDSVSSSSIKNDDKSSSSVKESSSSSVKSSSSVVVSSSSTDKLSSAKESSSSAKSSSSVKDASSSSSAFLPSGYVPPSGISYGTMRDDAGIEYRTVKIGDQNWMAENMALQNGESFCYGNETKNCTEYGRLYRWQTATEICPTGWHLPSKEEWEKLIAFVGGKDSAGVHLKATASWKSDGNGDDKYGFSAFSAGVGRFTSGAAYQALGTSTVFWTSDAYSVAMNWFDTNVTVDQYHGKEEALSVRCVEGFPPVVYGTMKDQVGIEYKTVTIDGKTWMAENLALQTSNSFCYDNDSDNCVKYGRLYMWDAAMKACPEGWHLPTFTEFDDLLHYVVWDVSGKVLKSESGWDGTDGVGFGALPAGYMSTPSSYYYLDTRAFFWTQTLRDDLPYCIEMITGQNKADINVQCNKEVGYSVRCVKN